MSTPGQDPPLAAIKDTRVLFDVWLTAVERRLLDLQQAVDEQSGRKP